MIVNVINLPHRTDRLESFLEQAGQQGFDYRVWDGVHNKKNAKEEICKAHKKIVQHAKENNISRICIAEDDIRFFAQGAWEYYLKNIPEDFDLYLGMIYAGVIDHENKITNGFSGMTLYVVDQRYYDTFLSIPDNSHIDQQNGEKAFNHKFIVCHPFVCEQTGVYSDHKWSTCDYTPLLEGRRLFGR